MLWREEAAVHLRSSVGYTAGGRISTGYTATRKGDRMGDVQTTPRTWPTVIAIVLLVAAVVVGFGLWWLHTSAREAHGEALQMIAELDEIIEAMEAGSRAGVNERLRSIRLRMQSLRLMSRDDLAALTREAAEVSGIRYIMDVDQGKVDSILDS